MYDKFHEAMRAGGADAYFVDIYLYNMIRENICSRIAHILQQSVEEYATMGGVDGCRPSSRGAAVLEEVGLG